MTLTDSTNAAQENAPAAPEAAPPAPDAPTPIEEVVTDEVVTDILRSYDPDLELVNYTAKLGSQLGDNYMSIMYAVDIVTKSKSTNSEKVFHIMLKTLPRNNFRQQMINEMKAFEKESRMYSEVFRDFVVFQKEKGLEEEEMFLAFPLCYSSFCNGTTDYLAMEDLKYSGFKMGNRLAGLDEDHIKLTLANLAKFHAVSFAMFDGDFDKILEKYPFLLERMLKKPEEVDDMYKGYMSSTFSSEGAQLRKIGLEAEAKLVEGVYDADFYDRLRRLAGEKVKWAVVGHGDCWTNNMLFSYDEGTGKPIAHKFLDFQISRASSRTVDLNYFFYTSLPMEILNNKESELLRFYHDTFSAFLKRLGYTNDELTFENLQKEMDEFRPFGVTMGLMLAPILCAHKEAVPDLESMEITADTNMDEMAKEFYSEMMKSDLLTVKLENFAKNHITRCREWSGGNN